MESPTAASQPSGPDWTRVGAGLLALGVLTAAFGAHALRDRVDPAMLTVFETGARHHMIHAVALLVLGQLRGAPRACGWLILAGVALFSGSLYAMTLSGLRWLGAITPLGGVSLVAGWSLLAIRGYQRAC